MLLPESRVVAAFQNLSARKLLAAGKSMEGDVVVCSDHDGGKAQVMSLVEVIDGLRAVDGGSLANARYVEQLTALLLNVNRIYQGAEQHSASGVVGVGMDGPRIVVTGLRGRGSRRWRVSWRSGSGCVTWSWTVSTGRRTGCKLQRRCFERVVAEATAGDGWVVDGNYQKTHDITWPRATMIVWLDYSFPRILWRLGLRILRRSVTREKLWNGNQENLWNHLFKKDSLILWAFHTYKRRQRYYAAAMEKWGSEGVETLRFGIGQRRRNGGYGDFSRVSEGRGRGIATAMLPANPGGTGDRQRGGGGGRVDVG